MSSFATPPIPATQIFFFGMDASAFYGSPFHAIFPKFMHRKKNNFTINAAIFIL